MRQRELSRQYQALKATFDLARSLPTDDEVRSHWGRYLCVLSAGFLENALALLYSEYVEVRAQPPVVSYASKQLAKLQNPKASRFIEVAGSFRRAWADELNEYLDQDGRREAIDSIMTNRHSIAHGKRSDITIARTRDYLDKAVQVLDFIEAQLGGAA